MDNARYYVCVAFSLLFLDTAISLLKTIAITTKCLCHFSYLFNSIEHNTQMPIGLSAHDRILKQDECH